MKKISIAIHGGAGTILKQDLSPEKEQAYLSGLKEAMDAGYQILEIGGSAMEAVSAAVVCLENNVLFNAGRGAVFTNKGTHELDAAIMDGKTLNAGAVAGVKDIPNPIKLAEEVLMHSDHVLLSGEGAMEFARQRNIETKDDQYFFSELRYSQWQALKGSNGYVLDHNNTDLPRDEKKFGTVGAVACDNEGNLAAATSTGGMTNKQFGRIGDSPIIGAGTYANNQTCAISCTGHGEPFMKAVAAYDVSCLMQYKNLSLLHAVQEVVHQKLVKLNGEGGMIAVDTNGNVCLEFNSAGMYRAYKTSEGEESVAIYQ